MLKTYIICINYEQKSGSHSRLPLFLSGLSDCNVDRIRSYSKAYIKFIMHSNIYPADLALVSVTAFICAE